MQKTDKKKQWHILDADGFTFSDLTATQKQQIQQIKPPILIQQPASSHSSGMKRKEMKKKTTEMAAGGRKKIEDRGKNLTHYNTYSYSVIHYSYISLQTAAGDVTVALKCINITQS